MDSEQSTANACHAIPILNVNHVTVPASINVPAASQMDILTTTQKSVPIARLSADPAMAKETALSVIQAFNSSMELATK